MEKQYQKKVLLLALYAGEIMMRSGAEVYRVEDTVTRICKACRIPFVESFATSTGLFLSLDKGGADDDVYTFIKRIRGSSIDLWKISKINNFSRAFSSTDLSVEEGMAILKRIDARKPFPFQARLLGAAGIGATFCLMFAGAPADCPAAAGAAAAAYGLSLLIRRLRFHTFISVFLSCSLASLLALIFWSGGLCANLNPVIIGAVTVFLPGVAITNSTRDLLSGEMLAGLSGATEAVLAAIAIASGTGLVLKLWNVIGGTLL